MDETGQLVDRANANGDSTLAFIRSVLAMLASKANHVFSLQFLYRVSFLKSLCRLIFFFEYDYSLFVGIENCLPSRSTLGNKKVRRASSILTELSKWSLVGW